MKPALVLFDLDGTLADTAPDLAAVANRMRAVRGLAPLPYDELRPLASHGARGLIGKALGVAQQESGFVTLRDEFFATYEAALCVHSRLFEGMEAVLGAIEARGARWGIVTNKMMRFTDPLVAALGLRERAACVVSGDTTPHAKPHPARHRGRPRRRLGHRGSPLRLPGRRSADRGLGCRSHRRHPGRPAAPGALNGRA
jgi:phosphoglycolate phosphatase-like HAD superfamily hydrolase